MGDEGGPKTAYELAMERLRRRDADAGVAPQVLTDAQKAAVAEVRSLYEAKIAQLEVLHQARMKGIWDPAERATLDAEYRHERERLAAERDARVEKARTTA